MKINSKDSSYLMNDKGGFSVNMNNQSLIRQNLLKKKNSSYFFGGNQLKIESQNQVSVQFSQKSLNSSVIETSFLDKSFDAQGNKKINNYAIIKLIGQGAFGKVKLALNDDDKQTYAIKISNKKKLSKKMFSRTANAFTLLQKEIAIMKKLDHPNVVRLYEVIDDPKEDKLYLVMEHMSKGSINSKIFFQQMEKSYKFHINIIQKTINLELAFKFIRDFFLGIDYLHNFVKVIHRDIKPDNLLISQNDQLKIADFGVSQIFENQESQMLKNMAGTKAYLAPELWEGKNVLGKPADIWSAGVTIYQIVFGKLPFYSSNLFDLQKKILEDNPEFPKGTDQQFKDMIEQMLQKNPNHRPSIQELMSHDWITNSGEEPLINNYENLAEFDLEEKELENAFQGVHFKGTVKIILKIKKNLKKMRQNIQMKKSLSFNQNEIK